MARPTGARGAAPAQAGVGVADPGRGRRSHPQDPAAPRLPGKGAPARGLADGGGAGGGDTERSQPGPQGVGPAAPSVGCEAYKESRGAPGHVTREWPAAPLACLGGVASARPAPPARPSARGLVRRPWPIGGGRPI